MESTYFLYRATGDHYYLEVGKKILKSLQKHARVTCGYAAIKVLIEAINQFKFEINLIDLKALYIKLRSLSTTLFIITGCSLPSNA